MRKYLLILVMLFFLIGCTSENTKTNTIHIVPENFEGIITAIYNVEGAPALKKVGDFSIIPYYPRDINEDSAANMVYEMVSPNRVFDSPTPDMIYDTSTADMVYGEVNDKFYYLINNERVPVPEGCIYHNGAGSIDFDEREYPYSTIIITQSCSPDFPINGPDELF